MTTKNKLLERIDFGNEAGDDIDPSELASYFVEQKLFIDCLSEKNRIKIITAKKGAGKSALIQWLSYKIQKEDKETLIIKCRGSDLARTNFQSTKSIKTPNEYIHDWGIRIRSLITRKLAMSYNPFKEEEHKKKTGGEQKKRIMSSLAEALIKAGINKTEKQTDVQLKTHRKTWLLIDDLDATFQRTEQENLEISTFFSACRHIIHDISNVYIRVTIRTDVWPIIRRYNESLDKMEQYAKEIIWKESDFRRLLAKRINHQQKELNIEQRTPPRYVHKQDQEHDLINTVFYPKIKWGEKETHAYKIIYTLSYHRPRWAIQLCKLAQRDALEKSNEKIGKNNIDQIWGDYGHQRIADLVSEHKHQCKEVEELITAFRGAPRLFNRDELIKWINNHINMHLHPYIEGKHNLSSTEIAHFMYRIGFLQARSQESDNNYEHYGFNMMPDFLTGRTNDDFGVFWEIHPCYREALDIQKINKGQRIKRGFIRT